MLVQFSLQVGDGMLQLANLIVAFMFVSFLQFQMFLQLLNAFGIQWSVLVSVNLVHPDLSFLAGVFVLWSLLFLLCLKDNGDWGY